MLRPPPAFPLSCRCFWMTSSTTRRLTDYKRRTRSI